MIKPVYLGNLTFSLQPVYDEIIFYDVSREEFRATFGDDSEVDYDDAWNNTSFQRDLERERKEAI